MQAKLYFINHLQAVQLLKSDGILVYSTCTINQEENEKQVVWTLKTFPQLALQSQV
jgi:16S rRNA (cytosine967-C5)-methyltransferase